MGIKTPPTTFPTPTDVFWKKEEWDDLIPKEGFLADFTLATKGIESPSQFCLWSGIFLISSVLKRESGLNWFPDSLYGNFFIFLVGPPKTGKSTAVNFGAKLLTAFPKLISDPKVQAQKRVNLLRSSATPEALSIALIPETASYVDNGRMGHVERGSQLSLILDELTVFLGKQKYNVGKIDRLGHLFDCLEDDDELTIGRGWNKFKDVYVTLIGGTTGEHMEQAIPEAAFGAGFMSRIIIVHAPFSVREYPTPRFVVGGPTQEQLAQRLAWVAENSIGAYRFTDEAEQFYNRWYARFKKHLKAEIHEVRLRSRYRQDIHLKKLSMILRASQYRAGREVELQDVTLALAVLERTYEESAILIGEIGAVPYQKWYSRVCVLLQEKRLTRAQLLRLMSPYHCKAVDLNEILRHLAQERKIQIRLNGADKAIPSIAGNEVYSWLG